MLNFFEKQSLKPVPRYIFFFDLLNFFLFFLFLLFSSSSYTAPSVLVAFLRFNPDHHLPLVFWDTILVFPFLIHIVLTIRKRDEVLSRRWSLVPCIIALLTSVLGVLLYDRKMHRLPDLNVVLSLSLCLLHGGSSGNNKVGSSVVKKV